MLKRKLIIFLLAAVILIPSLFVTAFAVNDALEERALLTATTRASYITCGCYVHFSSNITNHSGSFGNCSYDTLLNGTYSCASVNNAKTKLTATGFDNGYKDAYVFQKDASGATKSDLETADGYRYPSQASLNPLNSYVPVCVTHQVSTAYSDGSSIIVHTRNYQ